jgi:hypothetical protein
MRLLLASFLLVLISCNQNASKKDNNGDTVVNRDTTSIPSHVPINTASPLATRMRAIVSEKLGEGWAIVEDSTAGWAKDQFDYFIAPKRKSEPDYPYICQSDFDGDGKTDAAALVKKNGTKEFQLLIARDYNSPQPSIDTWKEDIDLCAVSVFPKSDLEGLEGKKVKMKADGIGIEYYETSSFVIYWTGKGFGRVWTGD